MNGPSLIPVDGRKVTATVPAGGLDVTGVQIGTLKRRSRFTMTGMFIRAVKPGDQLRLSAGGRPAGWGTVEDVDAEAGTMTLIRS